MALSRRVVAWAGAVAGGVLLVGLGVVFVLVGLDKADKISSTLGVFIGLIGLALSVYGVVLARRALAQQPTPDPEQEPEPTSEPEVSGQSVSGTVEGDNIQIGRARDVSIDRRRST
ncbi:hypothetical protein [Actinomadura macrotermitis]|nr:hypothetical protein [Actinomadura macrotermitis]